jgi:uncharacterized protein YndB with AHSA1/START domain
MQQSIAVDIDAPAARVWEVLSDAERWPEWTTSVRKVTLLDGGLRVGARAAIEQPRIGRTVWTVTSMDEGHGFVWEAKGLGFHATARHSIEETGAGHARAHLSVEQSGWLGSVMDRVYRRLTERYLALEAAGLKSRSEAR